MAANDERVRSIRLPERVWLALDEDAARCRRSPVRQLEALLIEWYELGDVGLYLPAKPKTPHTEVLPLDNREVSHQPRQTRARKTA